MWFRVRHRDGGCGGRRSPIAAIVLSGAAVVVLLPVVVDVGPLRAGIARRVQVLVSGWRGVPPATVQLEVPFLRQEHALSCEAAALRMVLAYRGIMVTERGILDAIGVDPVPRRRDADGTITWGDPDDAFVGNVDGSMGKTGYGVHAAPIGRVAGRYRRVEVVTDANSRTLTDAITAGNPVIVWGYVGRGAPLRWQTLGGKQVHAINGEHTRVVVGFSGPKDAPTGFSVLDPIYGEQYWLMDRFFRNWGSFGRTAVIVQ